jgi:hypothetical protein
MHSRPAQSFTEQLDKEQMEVFNAMSQLDYVGQACKFLDSFWSEVGDQAEFIFSVAYVLFCSPGLGPAGWPRA